MLGQGHELLLVRNAYKSFGKNAIVVENLNLSVTRGSIYGLLGPSGCGKTTLLKCVLGRMKLDEGNIYLNLERQSPIGYMPQETSLYGDFSIRENLMYFGELYGLNKKLLKHKIDHLLNFLKLHNGNLLIDNLSGGQQRRVSFAVSLLSESELLILDEPTVGVDIILSANIWDHLVKLASEDGKTIIVTTHYIEEAKNSHRIGMMRDGKILEEDSPNALMERYGCSNLEGVFLTVVRNREGDDKERPQRQSQNNRVQLFDKEIKNTNWTNSSVSLHRILIMMRKHILWMTKNIGMMIYMLFLPLFICVAFKVAVGIRVSNLALAVVNDELTSRLSSSCDSYSFRSNGCNFSTTLSCELFDILTRMDYRIVPFDDIDVAKMSKPSAVLYIGKNFSASIEKRLTLTGTESEIAESDILVWQDDSNYVVSSQINFDLGHACETLFSKLYAACDWIPTANRLPVLFNEAIYGSSLKSYNESTSANLCAALLFYLTMYFTMTSILWERLDGKLERTLISGGKFVEVCLAQLAIQCFYMITCIFIVWSVMYLWFQSPFAGSATYGIAFLILNSFVGVFNGLFFALLVSKLFHGTLLGIAVFMSLCLIGGVCWPVEGAYWVLKPIIWLCPGVYGNIAFESIALRGDIINASVYKGIINDVAWIIIFTIGSVYASKKIMLNLKR